MADVAQTLKLGVRQVEAPLGRDLGRLPGATFIRGFVRNYARLVEIDAGPLMEQLDGTLDRPAAPPRRPKPGPDAVPAGGRRASSAILPCWWSLRPGPGRAGVVVFAALLRTLAASRDVPSLGLRREKEVAAGIRPPRRRRSRGAAGARRPGPVAPGRINARRIQVPANPFPLPAVMAAPRRRPPMGRQPERRRGRCRWPSIWAESWVEVKDGDGKVLLPEAPGGRSTGRRSRCPFLRWWSAMRAGVRSSSAASRSTLPAPGAKWRPPGDLE